MSRGVSNFSNEYLQYKSNDSIRTTLLGTGRLKGTTALLGKAWLVYEVERPSLGSLAGVSSGCPTLGAFTALYSNKLHAS